MCGNIDDVWVRLQRAVRRVQRGAAVKSASAAATSAKSAGFAVAPMSSFGSAVISVLGLGAGLALVP